MNILITKVHFEDGPIKDYISSFECTEESFWKALTKEVAKLRDIFDESDWNYYMSYANLEVYDEGELPASVDMPTWDEIDKFLQNPKEFITKEMTPEEEKEMEEMFNKLFESLQKQEEDPHAYDLDWYTPATEEDIL